MGDDRYGHAPRPGGRAPWERYPAAEDDERDDPRSPRRGRRGDDADSAAPLTVQDLVQRVDSERTRRARPDRRAPAPPPEPAPPRGRPPLPNDSPPRGQEPSSRRPDAAPGRPPQRRAPTGPPTPNQAPAGPPPQDQAPATPSPSRSVQAPVSTPPPTRRPTERVVPNSRSTAPEATPEEVTDVIPPVDEPTRAVRKPKAKSKSDGPAWPTTESRAVQEKPNSRPPTRLAASKQRRNRRARVIGRSVIAIFAVLCLIATGGGWSYLRSAANSFTQVSALDGNQDDVVDSDAQLGDENYLIVGTDTRAGANGDVGAGTTDDAEGSRADTVMLVNIPQNRKRVVVVSFPRDLDVTRPQCNGWDNDKGSYTDETYPSADGDKLNGVYALGGPTCLVNVIRKMTGINIGHFIGIDFSGFETMVDQIGGVEVCTDKPIIDDMLGTVLENPGKQRISGTTALNYVRARHVYGDERSDYDRINRQQKFLASLLRGALSSKVMLDPGKMNGFVTAFTQHTFVDKVTVPDLLTLGKSLQKVDAGAVTFLTIPTAGTTDYGNEIPRESDIKAIFNAVRDDRPLPGEATDATAPAPTAAPPPAAPETAAVDPSEVSLLVSNGSGVEGLASQASNEFSNQGFGIYSTGNFSGGTSQTSKVRYSAGHEAEAATVASTIPGATVEETTELGETVEVVLGTNFDGTVQAPTPVGEPITGVAQSTESAGPTTLPPDLEHMNAAEDTCT